MRNVVVFTMKGCLTPITNHPFLVAMLLLLVVLYRSSPLAFSLLMYISPVVVSTGVLLGTLLSFGQMNVDEMQVRKNVPAPDISSRAGVYREATVFERDVCYPFEGRTGKEGNAMEELRLAAGKIVSVDRHCGSDDAMPMIKGRSREIDLDDRLTKEWNRELADLRHKEKYEMVEEQYGDRVAMKSYNFLVPKVSHLDSDFDRSEIDSYDSEIVNIDSMESPPPSPWKEIEILEEDVDGAIDDWSDQVLSSSPDASMSDILPVLDELHPLLDEDTSQLAQLLPPGSHTDLKYYPTSSNGILEDETYNNQELDIVEDNEDDDEVEEEEEEEEEQVDKEQMKSAITWTEEDEKNLMDLGSSEIERNQRLESLMERRKSRKSISMVLDRNLIDFESSNVLNNIAPISTTRQNPFDIPHDSYDNEGLPPVPGSAPSILVPGQNPFAIPYESIEERPNIMGDGLQEYIKVQPRERFFRHESFNVGPSTFAANRQDNRFRPYFVPERSVFEDLSNPPSQQHSSECSDSKISSILDTESFNSVEDLDDKELVADYIYSEPESTSEVVNVMEEHSSRQPDMSSLMEKVIIEDITHKPEPISKTVGHGSQYHEESLQYKINERQEVDKLETRLAGVKNICREGSVALPMEIQNNESPLHAEPVENRFSKGPSTSPTSEMKRRIFLEIVSGGATMFEEATSGAAGELKKPNEAENGGTDLSVSSALVDDIPHSEPVYDSSPPHVSKNNSSSSISSNVHVESDMSLLPLLVKRVVPVPERELEGSNQEKKKGTPNSIAMPTSKPPINKDVPEPRNVEVRRTEDVTSDHKKVLNGIVESGAVSSSVSDPSLVGSRGKQGTPSEWHVAEPTTSAQASLIPKQDIEGKLEKEDNSTSREESAQMKAHKVGSSEKVDQRSVKVAAEKPDSGARKAEDICKTTAAEGQEDSDKTNSS